MLKYKNEIIYLKKHGPKKWQYKSYEIVSVELAVLDYLKDNGWQGYFTEQFNYDELLIQMMCWKNHSVFPTPKLSDPENFHLFPRICLFAFAKDGYWKHCAHEFTCEELLNNAINFQLSDIPKVLNDWNNQKAKFRKTRNGERARKDWQKLCDLKASDLISYYQASGGKEYFLELINKKYPKELMVLWNMSSLIFQAADKRVMMPHSEFMFHHGSMWYGGTSKQFLTEAEQLKKSCKTMTDIYTERMKEKGCFSKRSREFINKWLEDGMKNKEEVYMDAKETVKHGFADEIFGEKGVYDWTSLLTFEE